MQVICISRGTLAGGRVLAERLASDLGYPCLSREKLIEAAIDEGIHVGKIETAMVKGRGFSERLVLEREHYLAFSRAYLCQQALKGSLVYHGRTGHLLLPGVPHVLRVRAVSDYEHRLKIAMESLGLEREKARRYLEEVDEDRRLWSQTMYGVSCADVDQYDVIVNLQQLSVENASAALTSVAQLPDFQLTPASRRTMEDLYLGARARVLLARDERTFRGCFKVTATDGVVTATYMPQDARLADSIPRALETLEGCREVRATMAASNILWIQETFDATSEVFRDVVEIASKWGAAVELIRLAPGEADAEVAVDRSTEPETPLPPAVAHEYNGGIEDDAAAEPAPVANGGLRETVEELARLGRSAGGREVKGGQVRLLETIDRRVPYTMAVVGEVFLDKGSAARMRMARELRAFLSDNLKTAVVATEDLRAQFLFGRRDVIRLVEFLAVSALIYFLVFTHQEQVLSFLSREGWVAKTMAAVAVFLFIPIVAYSYGTVTRSFLKLIKIE